MTFKIPRSVIAVFFLFGTLCASNVSAAAPHRGDLFVSASIAEPSNLIPILASDSASQEVVGKVFNGLVRYNPKMELEGDLAESWEILDAGKTILFHLRKGVVWHDGAPFTARDVEFTYRKLIDPGVPTPYGGDFAKVSALEVVDDYTVRVSYPEPFAPALASWGMAVMPKHLLEKENFLQSRFTRNPVGTGPYRFRRWLDGDRVELAAFDRYYEGRPSIDGVVYRVIPDQATMFLELHTQTVDEMSLSPLQYLKLTGGKYFAAHFKKFRYPTHGYTYLGYNLRNDLFKDVRVRRALGLAIDKQEIIRSVLMGLGRETTGPFVPGSWAYDPEVKPAPFDPQAARALLAEAGWRDTDADGILDKDGKAFRFTIITNQGNLQRQLCAEIIQHRLAEVGIEVRIKIVEWSAFLKEFVDKKNFDAVLMAWGLSLDPDPFDIWHSSKTREGEFNFISYANPEVDRLIEEGRRIFDTDKRGVIYRKIHALIHADEPVSFLYVADALPIVHARFSGIDVTPIGIGYNFIRWSVPAAEQKYTRYEL